MADIRRMTSVGARGTNPVLPAGVYGWERDTGVVKLGDGVTQWNSLGLAGIAPGAIPASVVLKIEAVTASEYATLPWVDPEIMYVIDDGRVLLGSKSLASSGLDQPADSDLTAIAALVTTSYGRSLLTTADVDALATALAPRAAYTSRYLPTVNHGSTAATPRVGTAPCRWIGSVDPTNAANDDELYRTDTTALYERVSDAWVEVGSLRFGALNEDGFASNSATLPPTQRSTTNYLTAKVPTGAIVFPNTTGNYASAADAAALDVTGDAEWVVDLAMVDWTPSSPQGSTAGSETLES